MCIKPTSDFQKWIFTKQHLKRVQKCHPDNCFVIRHIFIILTQILKKQRMQEKLRNLPVFCIDKSNYQKLFLHFFLLFYNTSIQEANWP